VILAPGAAARPLTAGVPGVEELRLGRFLRTVVLRHPPPGWWRVQTSHGELQVDIRALRFAPRGTLLAPAGGGLVHQFDRVRLTYQITDERGAPLQELPGYPLECAAVLVAPGGRRLPVPMDRRPPRRLTVFRSRESPACELVGRYRTEVLLTVRDLDGQRVAVLRDLWSGFAVASRRS
jgi:hypothetical protein